MNNLQVKFTNRSDAMATEDSTIKNQDDIHDVTDLSLKGDQMLTFI